MSTEIDMSTVNTILVPSGRDYERCTRAFGKQFNKAVPPFDGRSLFVEAGRVDYHKVKGKDIPYYIAEGFGDIGLTGSDVCWESIPEDPDASNVRWQEIGDPMCGFYMLFPEEEVDELMWRLYDPEGDPVTIATSFPNFLAHCLEKASPQFNAAISGFRLSGSVEGAPRLGVAQMAADLVESGDTVRANRMKKGPKLADVRPAVLWRDPAMPVARLRMPSLVD